MLENLELAGYALPTPIQTYTFPAIKMGHDVVACAQTGQRSTCILSSLLANMVNRFRKDRSFLDPYPVQAYGQG